MKKIVCCFTLFIGVLLGGILLAQPSGVFAAQAQQSAVLTENVCPEGQYLDLTTNYCRNLDKNFGFDADAFAQSFKNQQYVVDSCSEGALKSALDRAENGGGGIVQLPACTIELGSPVAVPNNTILSGAGKQETVIKATSGLSGGNMVNVKYGQNVIIRDMTIDGDGKAARAVMVWYANNILAERLETLNGGSSGIVFRYTSGITIRYVESHNNRDNHGIGSKDCFNETLESCEDSAGDVSPGVLWSQDYAIYSNNLHHNGKYGLDSHASYGEVAGNLLVNNGYGSKFPDASYVWIHRNQFKNNGDWATHIYSTLKIPEQYPQNIVFYENEFASNGGYPLTVASPSKNIYMLENTYQDNDPNKLRINEVTVYVCNATADAALAVDGTTTKTATATQCDLSSVAHLFGQDSDSPDDLLPEEPVNATPVATTAPGTVQLPEPTPVPVNTPGPGGNPLRETAINVPGRIEAEAYLAGGEGVGYHDTTPENAGNEYRNDDVDIEKTSDAQGVYNVGWIEAGEWLAYDLEVQQAGTYRLSARLRSWGAETQSLRVKMDGQDVTGSVKFTRPATGENWFDVELGDVQLTAGQHTMRIVMESSGFNLNYVDLVLTAPADPPVGNPDEPANPLPHSIYLPVIDG